MHRVFPQLSGATLLRIHGGIWSLLERLSKPACGLNRPGNCLTAFSRQRVLKCFVGIWALVTVVGCSHEPVAPELRDSPVYRNAQEGIRFLVPDNWTQSASANLPVGDLEGELFLVRYNVLLPESTAQVQVLCYQDRTGTDDLVKHQQEPAFGIPQWTLKEGPKNEQISGQEGTWMYLTGRSKEREMGKEVLCFRRGDRVYSFVGTFWTSDEKARQVMHRAFQSVIWE